MKSVKILASTLPLIALGFASVSYLSAEPPPGPPRKEQRERGPQLSEEERAQLRTAMEAVREEPAVVAAREALKAAGEQHTKVLKEALLKKDPSLAPVLEKLGKAFPPRMLGRDGDRRAGGKPEGKPDGKRKKAAEDLMEAAPE